MIVILRTDSPPEVDKDCFDQKHLYHRNPEQHALRHFFLIWLDVEIDRMLVYMLVRVVTFRIHLLVMVMREKSQTVKGLLREKKHP